MRHTRRVVRRRQAVELGEPEKLVVHEIFPRLANGTLAKYQHLWSARADSRAAAAATMRAAEEYIYGIDRFLAIRRGTSRKVYIREWYKVISEGAPTSTCPEYPYGKSIRYSGKLALVTSNFLRPSTYIYIIQQLFKFLKIPVIFDCIYTRGRMCSAITDTCLPHCFGKILPAEHQFLVSQVRLPSPETI